MKKIATAVLALIQTLSVFANVNNEKSHTLVCLSGEELALVKVFSPSELKKSVKETYFHELNETVAYFGDVKVNVEAEITPTGDYGSLFLKLDDEVYGSDFITTSSPILNGNGEINVSISEAGKVKCFLKKIDH